MSARRYRLGRRQAETDSTRTAILTAARRLVAETGPEASLVRVAKAAGVSRLTLYSHFGSKAGLLEALAAGIGSERQREPAAETGGDPLADLEARIEHACAFWSADPALYRQLYARGREHGEPSEADRALAGRLAGADRLRPGTSIKEAEDVIGIVTSFPAFDRLHKGGRRSPTSVAEILLRMASGFMTPRPAV